MARQGLDNNIQTKSENKISIFTFHKNQMEKKVIVRNCNRNISVLSYLKIYNYQYHQFITKRYIKPLT